MSLADKSKKERMIEFAKEQEALRQKKLAELELAQKRKEMILMKRIEEKRQLLQEKKSLEFQRQKAAELRRKARDKAEMEKLMTALKRYSERQENLVNKNYYKPLPALFGGKISKASMPNSNPCNSSSRSTVAFGSALILSHHLNSPHNGNKMMGKKSNNLMTRSVMHHSPSNYNNNSLKTYSTSVSQLPTLSKHKNDDHLQAKPKHSNSRSTITNETNLKRPNFLDLASKRDKTNGSNSKGSRITSVKPSQFVGKSNTFVKSTCKRWDTDSRHLDATQRNSVSVNTNKNTMASSVSVECHKSHKVTKIKDNAQKATLNDPTNKIVEISLCNSSESISSCHQDLSDPISDILNLYAILPSQPHFYIPSDFNSTLTEERTEILNTQLALFERDFNEVNITPTQETSPFSNITIIEEKIEEIVTGDHCIDKELNDGQSISLVTKSTNMTEREAKLELALKRKLVRELALLKINSDAKLVHREGEEIAGNNNNIDARETVSTPTAADINKEKLDIKSIQRERELKLEEVAHQKRQQIIDEARQREEDRKARKQKVEALMSRTRPQTKLITESFCPDSNCVITAYTPFSTTSLSTIKVQTQIIHHSEDSNYIS